MANRLPKTLDGDITWFVQCTYCNPPDARPNTPRRHEVELLAKAKRLCKNHETNHFLDFVTAELDTLNHAILTQSTMVEILTEIHEKLGCTCLTHTTQEIEDLTKSDHNIHIPMAYRPLSTATTTATTTPKKPAKTLLERLQNGKNGQHQTGK